MRGKQRGKQRANQRAVVDRERDKCDARDAQPTGLNESDQKVRKTRRRLYQNIFCYAIVNLVTARALHAYTGCTRGRPIRVRPIRSVGLASNR